MNRMLRAGLYFLLFALPLWAAAQSLPMRLPDGVAPLSYRLALTLDPARSTHSGKVSIALDIKAATRTIRLNASDIVVTSAVLKRAGKTYAARARVADSNLLDLVFAAPVPAGPGELTLAFRGRLDDKGSQGLFRQKEGADWYVFTQFEATDARRAFPVFDEPRWKVPWTLSLTIPAKLTAVANTAVAREVALAHGLKRVEFLTTPPLPSYLVAFGVGPFDILDAGRVGATPLRFITPRGRAAEARYAARMTPPILAQLEAYFGIAYPYGKLDVMALPITLNFGAMENPGLVTFAARLLLAREAEETANFKRSFVEIQAHELAHQWFGDYVTMAWWDDLWLNESFASWMGDKITAQVMPEWRFETGTQEARAEAMAADRLLSARRIQQPVNDPESLESAFDSITYSKGQATLAMFENWLGDSPFQAGVQRYMARHAWGSATGDDFDAALAAGQPELAAAFRSFTGQPGIPRLSVTLVCQDKPLLRLSQSRFLPSSLSGLERGMRWSQTGRDARRSAQPMAGPLASVATPQTPRLAPTQRAGGEFGASRRCADSLGTRPSFVDAPSAASECTPVAPTFQARQAARGSAAAPAALWQIPVTVRTPAGRTRILLKEATGSLPLPDTACPAWVEANADGVGYYRPVYGPGQLLKLMMDADLSVSEILADLDDAQALTESGDLPVADALALALRYTGHARREVLEAALGIIAKMEPLIAPDQRAAYAALWQRAFGERAHALGLTGKSSDSDDDRLIRARWLGRLVEAGQDGGLRAQARELTQAWLKDRGALEVASRGLVLRSAAIDGDRALFDALVQAARASKDRSERRDIYGALARFVAPELALAAHQLWLSPLHDIRELLPAGREHQGGAALREGLLAFVSANFDAIAARLPKESVGRFPNYFANFCAADKALAVEQFFAPRLGSYPGGSNSLAQSLERIRLCAVYRDAQRDSLTGFLTQR
ncbi:MAG: M1 family metallopeptidase [Rhodoferax sp.]|uniref:M1 family metallopeptidase n=1 Tax=Rhodoferax sp. TaxID=50421 RepID=UPI0026289354|nr:M1 family metallopeptidase [Rhodoferax sp.]MDD5333112.1 M1 family metallopeptidase [Rhodoferax sp.]